MIISKMSDIRYDHKQFVEAFGNSVPADASAARYAENATNAKEYIAMYVTHLWTMSLSAEEKTMINDSFEEMLSKALEKEGSEFLKERLISFIITDRNPLTSWRNRWSWSNSYTDLRRICLGATKNLMNKGITIIFEETDFYPTDWKLQSEFVEKFFSTFSRIATL